MFIEIFVSRRILPREDDYSSFPGRVRKIYLQGENMVLGLNVFSETEEQALINYVRSEVGGTEHIVDRLPHNPTDIEIGEGHTLLAISTNDRVHAPVDTHDLLALQKVVRPGHRIGYFAILTVVLPTIHPRLARRFNIAD